MSADIVPLASHLASEAIGSLQSAGQRVRFDSPTAFARLRQSQTFTLRGFWTFTYALHQNDVLLLAPNETSPLYQARILQIKVEGSEAIFHLRWLDDVNAR